MLSVSQLYKELDSMFANHASAQEIEKYLLNALNQSQAKANQEESNQAEANQTEANAQALQLSVLNELMGFYRSRGEHAKNKPIIDNCLLYTSPSPRD